MRITTTLLLCAMLAAVAPAQDKDKPQAAAAPAATPAAKPGEVDSMEHILAALYDVISGPMGQKRDWERFRSLFVTGARLIPVGSTPQGGFAARVLTVEEYIARTQPLLEKQDFFENEIARNSESYGHIVQVFSTYESRHAKGEKPFARGINSIQLMNDGRRWWLVTVLWEAERPGTPIPEKYLVSGRD